jgi:hypothetical protein
MGWAVDKKEGESSDSGSRPPQAEIHRTIAITPKRNKLDFMLRLPSGSEIKA